MRMRRMRAVAIIGITTALLVSPWCRAEPPAANGPTTYRVPYRLSETLHILVRAKFNGVGPFSFIVDTGAPMLLVSSEVAKRVGVKVGPNGWTRFKLMELEGGARIDQVDAYVEDIYQLRGMNGLGLAGTRLHGVLGYTILARYRMEFDFSKRTMLWTEVGVKPRGLPMLLGGRGARHQAPSELETVGSLMQQLGNLFGRGVPDRKRVRGLLGAELEQQDGTVLVKAVLVGSPADRAGLKSGDRIVRFAGKPISRLAGLMRAAALLGAGQKVTLTVLRAEQRLELAAKLERGF